jgi:hypothetical protein
MAGGDRVAKPVPPIALNTTTLHHLHPRFAFVAHGVAHQLR